MSRKASLGSAMMPAKPPATTLSQRTTLSATRRVSADKALSPLPVTALQSHNVSDVSEVIFAMEAMPCGHIRSVSLRDEAAAEHTTASGAHFTAKQQSSGQACHGAHDVHRHTGLHGGIQAASSNRNALLSMSADPEGKPNGLTRLVMRGLVTAQTAFAPTESSCRRRLLAASSAMLSLRTVTQPAQAHVGRIQEMPRDEASCMGKH